MRLKFALIMIVLCIGGALSVTALSPEAAGAAQRIDMNVLLLGATGTEPSFQAWQAELRREGVPFDQLVATPGHAPITAATLSQTLADGTQEAKYQAVIVSTGGLYTCDTTPCTSALSADEWTALQTFEQSFHVRQLTAYVYPGADYGLSTPTASGPLDGQTANLTPAGQQAFPYLRGPVTFDTGTYGYQAAPADPASFATLLAGPGDAALVGVFTHPDGREELVQTFDGNQFQSQSALLRHGELSWATRGTFFGDQRNYLELHVDDVFLPDDSWNVAAHATDYDPAHAIRMTAPDVARSLAWSRSTGLRLDLLFNGGGSDAYVDEHGSDPLLAPFQAAKTSFGWVNHTFEHPNLDCSTRNFISAQITDNVAWARRKAFTVNAGELVTGEHSGLANLVPGSPGTIDPPGIDSIATPLGGTLALGTFDYVVTAVNAAGETAPSLVTVTTKPLRRSVRLGWDAICKATGYRVYRRTSPSGGWTRVAAIAQPSPAFNNNGAVNVTITDTGGAGSAGAPPTTNTAALSPYGQNPAFVNALTDARVTSLGADASKPYPQNPASVTGPQWPAGTSFVDGPARVSPRYPTNVYYNVATQAQLLDEYNWLYLPPSLGGVCVNTSVTTCRTAPATWSELVTLEAQRIFGHMMGNDPRPHYFHQSNLAQSSSEGGAVFYAVLDATLATYGTAFSPNAPIVQLTPTQIGDLLGRQAAWSSASASAVRGWIEGSRVTIANGSTTTAAVPLTGTEVGGDYGGSHSGWTSAARGSSVHTATTAWPAPSPAPAPAVTVQAPAAQLVAHVASSPSSSEPTAPPASPTVVLSP